MDAAASTIVPRRITRPDTWLRNGGLLGIWLLLLIFIVYPLLMLLSRAFLEDGHLNLQALLAAITAPKNMRALGNSLLLATLVGVAGTLLGLIFAFTVERVRGARRISRLIDFFTFLPLISPPFTTSIAFVFSFGPRGLITYELLGIKNVQVYGLTSTFAAETLTYFPIAYLALRPMLASISTGLEEASFSLGGSRWHAFRTVTLPLVIPALANAFLLLFGCSLADFATPLILAGSDFSVLPTEAYLQITGLFDLKGGAILSLLLLVPAGLVFYVQERVVAGRSYVTVTGKAAVSAQHDSVSVAAGAALLAFCLLVSALIVYFYLLLFYASIVLAFGANHTLTLEHYRVIFSEGLPAIWDTLIIAMIGMPLGGIYGIVLGYLIGRTNFVGRKTMAVVSMLNYALPGTIVGIAYLLAFNDDPLPLTGTAAIIIACYVFRYSPIGIRTTVALLQQIDKSMEEASASLGAGSFTTFRRIMLPLILPAFFAGLGVVFIRSMTAISATIFLVSINWTLITVKILENMTEVALGAAAAFSVFVIVVVVAVTSMLNILLQRLTAPSLRVSRIGA
jgi:iron(III) transport system permease protein